MDLALAYVLAVIFLATLIRSTFGFGEALVAVPMLALRVPVRVAAPLAVLVSITVAAIVVAQDWRHVYVRPAMGLVAATILGIPVGLLLLTRVNEHVVKALLAALIIAFSSYSLLNPGRLQLARDRLVWLLGFGFLAGVLGGAYGMNGPPLVVYGSLRRWSAERFRATLQGYFLPASVAGMIGYWIEGLWVPTVTRDYLLSLPLAVCAIFLGRLINRRLHGHAFQRIVHVGLIVIGLTLLIQAARR